MAALRGPDSSEDERRLGNGIENNIYKTLSEGEKTLITFLYFLELCDGRLGSETNSSKEKLIVIDDPISSLSHDYIYEISSLIHHRLIKKMRTLKLLSSRTICFSSKN